MSQVVACWPRGNKWVGYEKKVETQRHLYSHTSNLGNFFFFSFSKKFRENASSYISLMSSTSKLSLKRRRWVFCFFISAKNSVKTYNGNFFSFLSWNCCTVWKITINAITQKIFREINSLVTSLVKTLIWRKKCWFYR